MIDLAFVESLIKALDESGLDTLELERGGTKVRLSKSPPLVQRGNQDESAQAGPTVAGPPAGSAGGVPGEGAKPSASPDQVEAEAQDAFLKVICPMVGTFYSSPSPDAAPYVTVGQRVGKGAVLCIIEAMKLMNELESEFEGTIAKVMVENAQPVEYGQTLFLIDPS